MVTCAEKEAEINKFTHFRRLSLYDMDIVAVCFKDFNDFPPQSIWPLLHTK